jgi:hypothetical protein
MPLSLNEKIDAIADRVHLINQRNRIYDEHRYLSAKDDFRRWKEEATDREAAGRTAAQEREPAIADTRFRFQPIFDAYGQQPPVPVADQASDVHHRRHQNVEEEQ